MKLDVPTPNDLIVDKDLTNLQDKIHRQLKLRLIFYFCILCLALGIAIYHILEDWVNIFFPSVALFTGMGIGFYLSRIHKISWDKRAKKVISQMDTIGILMFAGYIIFTLHREEIIDQFIHGPAVVATSFSLLAGIMYGRIAGVQGKIKEVFRQQKIIK